MRELVSRAIDADAWRNGLLSFDVQRVRSINEGFLGHASAVAATVFDAATSPDSRQTTPIVNGLLNYSRDKCRSRERAADG